MTDESRKLMSLLVQMSGRALSRIWNLSQDSKEGQGVNRTGKMLIQEELDD